MNLFRRRSVADLQAEVLTDKSLKRALGPVNLTALGIGAVIGAGIFVLTGQAAAKYAGPAIVFSFVLAGLACAFAGLCYAEFSAMIPISGSAYTYGYATLGEFVAWIIGWDLILEYLFAASTVAVGWSGYVVSFLQELGIAIPSAFTSGPYNHITPPDAPWWNIWRLFTEGWVSTGAVLNVPAMLIVGFITFLLVLGIKESATFNNVVVAIKMSVILTFIAVGIAYINRNNWHPFIPPSLVPGEFGWGGVVRGAGVIFFAYIGFDAVSTAAQEAKNPQRDMPIGIIGSLLLCTVFYILVSAIATGVVPYQQLDVPDPIALAADHAGMGWMGRLIKLGAIAGLSSVVLVMLLGQSRVFYSMARDGLLPPVISRVHPRFQTPWLGSIITGLFVAFFAAVLNVRDAGSLCSIGTLLAFVVVSVGILVLRVREPELPRRFKAPWVWFVAPAGAFSALWLMSALPWPTWRRLIVWFLIGMVVYVLYGIRHSKLAPPRRGGA